MGSPLRVLHVVVNMNRGGAETLIMNLYRNVDRTKVQFDFLTCKEGVFDEEIGTLGGKIHRIPYITEAGHFGFKRALRHFFSTHQEYNIVHSHLDKMSGIVMKEAKKANVPVRIAHSHNTSSEGGTVAKLYKWYVGNNVTSNATHFLACSNTAANWLFKQKASNAKVLRNGIECEKFGFNESIRQEVRNELSIDKDTLVLGHVGRFSHQKNHTFLLDIVAQVIKKRKKIILLLVGDGPLRLNIEEQIKELEIQNHVYLLGIRNDIARILQAMDMFVFPSLHEGLPVTLIEAQASSTSCLISSEITREVDMGLDLIKFLSLQEKHTWIEHICDSSIKRVDNKFAFRRLTENGYDIAQTATITEEFYLQIAR